MNTHQRKENNKSLILVVDDDQENLQMLDAILRTDNYMITFAESGLHTFKSIENNPPDLILLDIMMTDLDGYRICKKLKESSNTKDIPIIFLTAKTETDDIVKGFQFGAVDYVTKPFNSIELLARVRTHLELKKAWDTQKKTIIKLEAALTKVKQLSGLLPICCHCKKIRDDNGYWQQVERYITEYSEAEFTHGICPDCLEKYYPEHLAETSS
ncbi:MAG: response regulator [Candidatus Hatepunaea meridiana]|nr:response regulator [Candidatus Hatepunaea meridiana]